MLHCILSNFFSVPEDTQHKDAVDADVAADQFDEEDDDGMDALATLAQRRFDSTASSTMSAPVPLGVPVSPRTLPVPVAPTPQASRSTSTSVPTRPQVSLSSTADPQSDTLAAPPLRQDSTGSSTQATSNQEPSADQDDAEVDDDHSETTFEDQPPPQRGRRKGAPSTSVAKSSKRSKL
jgi:hypothetical protein